MRSLLGVCSVLTLVLVLIGVNQSANQHPAPPLGPAIDLRESSSTSTSQPLRLPMAGGEIRPIPQLPVAPGGMGKIAYIDDGDVWVTAIPSGQSHRLTSGSSLALRGGGISSTPELAWSPSGNWLLLGDTVIGADGRYLRTNTGCVQWSPVRDELICHVEDTLWIESPDGGPSTLLMQDVGPLADIAWSQGGESVAFAVTQRIGTPSSSIWSTNRKAGSVRKLLSSDDVGADRLIPAFWSDDGEQLAYFYGVWSASIQSDGMALGVLDLPSSTHGGVLQSVHLKPDFFGGFTEAGQLLYTHGAGRLMTDGKRIGLVDLMTSRGAMLTDGTSAISPALSPDGITIAFTSGETSFAWGGNEVRDAVASRRIWLMNTDGSNMRRLTSDERYREEHAQWSADGRNVVFARISLDGDLSLWYADMNGGEAREIAGFHQMSRRPNHREAIQYGYYGYVNWAQHYAWWQPK